MSRIRLVADTNLFIQCRALADLPWERDFASFDEVTVIVTRPVQKEIDGQKKRRESRVGKRARDAASFLRDRILADEPFVIRDKRPHVSLEVRLEIKATSAWPPELDLDDPDDHIVACGLILSKGAPDLDTRLLTHDGGPMGSAKSVGLGLWPIPDDWLRPPEPSSDGRRIQQLERRLRLFEKQGPMVQLDCEDCSGSAAIDIHYERPEYSPLSQGEVAELTASLAHNVPPTALVDNSAERRAKFGLEIGKTFKPVTERDIQHYIEVRHPKWLKKCATYLGNLHTLLAERTPPATLRIVARNIGSQPATSALIEFQISGDLLIIPSASLLKDSHTDTDIGLPWPPPVPKGKWVDSFRIVGVDSWTKAVTLKTIGDLSSISFPEKRDSNSWYYRGGMPDSFQKEFALSCEQWRHASGPKSFDVSLSVSGEVGEGLFAGTLHAENLPTPQKITVPIRCPPAAGSTYSEAVRLIRDIVRNVQE